MFQDHKEDMNKCHNEDKDKYLKEIIKTTKDIKVEITLKIENS